jgi:hypothetical protein
MRHNSLNALITLLFLIGVSFGSVTMSSNSIDCCSQWQSIVTVTNSNNEPMSNCKIFVSVMEVRSGIETTIGRYSYFTDSAGQALLSYTPKRPGEKLKINVLCGENKVENIMTVTGNPQTPTVPGLSLEFPSIEASQIAIVAFLIFATVLIYYGRPLMHAMRKSTPKQKEQRREDLEEFEMSPRHLILDHERKVAARLAKKHKRKEIRLGHEFVRKL